MNKIKYLIVIILGLALAACARDFKSEPDTQTGVTYDVYFLGGQSNMDGYGYNSELPADLLGEFPAIRIFNGLSVADGETGGGAGIWSALTPGFGAGFSYDGTENQLSERFGPELTFGLQMAQLNPESNIAIVKFARGGSSLSLGAPNFGTWDPDYGEKNGRNQYDNALTAIAQSFSEDDIDGDGRPDRLHPKGIVWMQGESDAIDQGPAQIYQINLKRTMDLLRAALRDDDLPVVIGRITDSGMDEEDGQVMDHIALVQQAQAEFVQSDSCAAYVTEINDYSHSDDAWHYDSDGYVKMGRAFAKAMHGLAENCGPQ